MPDNSKDSTLRQVLEETSTIAMVGASTNPVSPSLFVATYFSGRGRRVIPINPTRAGETLLGETILASIRDIPSNVSIDLLDVFRRSDAVPSIVDDALAHLMPGLKAVWMQYGVRHEAAAAKARAHGLIVVQDRCPKVEHMRLFGGPNLAGIGGVRVLSKLPRGG